MGIMSYCDSRGMDGSGLLSHLGTLHGGAERHCPTIPAHQRDHNVAC